MIKGLILDLDQTLVDSSIATEARRCRDWQRVYSLIPLFRMYQGITDALDIARNKGLKIAIVSNSNIFIPPNQQKGPHAFVRPFGSYFLMG